MRKHYKSDDLEIPESWLKAIAWLNFLGVVAFVYGARVTAYKMRMASEKAARAAQAPRQSAGVSKPSNQGAPPANPTAENMMRKAGNGVIDPSFIQMTPGIIE